MKLVIQDRPLFGNTFVEKLNRIASIGFDGLEIDGDVLLARLNEIKMAIQSTGVPITSICGGYRGWIGDFERENREMALHDLEKILKCTAEIGAIGVVAPAAFGIFSHKLPPFKAPRTSEEDKQVLLESLFKINRIAEAEGTTLLLEPLNRYEDHMINTLDQAAELIREGNFHSIKIIADFFHMNMEEKNIVESIHNAKDLIWHVHLSDSNRLQPGLGHTDFVSAFRALRDIGYDESLAIDSPFVGDPSKVYSECCDYLRECLEKSQYTKQS
ncbi:sugar phosphate isomerase/epimerase family protein [Neobacillus bataviensis]|uniref:sugar phosphate isomerase/epimerase family protein n=1 Tax=Neobacillus bataviensis TaxID=220685 RepID=UPI001CBB9AB2|nr:sugar phosphate isomerase/epimerase family protein [Neobacillus bataviensis]